MKLQELITILKRLYRQYIRKHLRRIFYSFLLSLIVAGSTASIAYLLDPAVKKIFIDNDRTLAWLIPLAIMFVFTAKGLSLYFARTLVIKVGALVSGEMQKQIANNILITDIQSLDNRHSGHYISNIMFDSHQVETLASTGILNLMKDTFSLFFSELNVLSKLEVSIFCNSNDAISCGTCKEFREKNRKSYWRSWRNIWTINSIFV